MVLNFPSGRLSVSIREIQKHRRTRKGCGICDELWGIDDECIGNQLHCFHPCQHVVGSHCWSLVADEQKGKCPVCKVEIRCIEKIRVHATAERCTPASPNSQVQEPEKFLILARDLYLRALALEVEDRSERDFTMAGEQKEGTDDVEVDNFECFINLCARVSYVKDGLHLLQDSSDTLIPIRWDRMTSFVADTAHAEKRSKRLKIDVAMFSSGGTYLTMNDLRDILASAEEWTKKNFDAIHDGRLLANKDAIFLRKMDKMLADVEAEIKELQHLESREIKRRQKAEFEESKNHDSRERARYQKAALMMDIREVNKKADEEILSIRAEADDKIEQVRAKASAEIAKLQSYGKVAEV